MAKYTNQIVVFLDVLGVKNMLREFEGEALANSDVSQSNYHESDQLNKLLEIFKESLNLIKKADCNYNVFSDNICINISYITEESEKPDTLVEILILISRLTNEFAKHGYFLRGGVDVGWFLDYPHLAVGWPLVTAYYLESVHAIFPRVVLSTSFTKLLTDYLDAKKIREEFEDWARLYITRDKSLAFVNPFVFITQFEEKSSKIDFLTEYSTHIRSQLENRRHEFKVRKKYAWLALQFDSFIRDYLLHYKNFEDPDLEFTTEEILKIQELRIYQANLPLWLISTFPALGRDNKK